MKIKYLLLGFLLILIAPHIFSYGKSLDKAGLSTWGWLVELVAAICVWIGTPMIIYGQVASWKPYPQETWFSKIARGVTIPIAVLSVGYLTFECSSAITLFLERALGAHVNEFFVIFWGIIGLSTGGLSLIINLIVWAHANAHLIYSFLRNLPPVRCTYTALGKVALHIAAYAERCGYRLSRLALSSLALHLFIVLTIVTPPNLGWLRWIAVVLSLWFFGSLGKLKGYEVLLEQTGRNITPVLALSGILYSYFLVDPLSSAISNSFGVFFLFYSINLPKLILQKDNFFERFLFSLICGFVAFGGNIFMGSTLSVLEGIRKESSYSVLGDRLEDALGPSILVILCVLAAELFCDAPLLRMRGVSDYSYEKASGSLFYLSFLFGFGGNKIISPLLFLLSFLLIIKARESTKKVVTEFFSGMSDLRKSLARKFMDTSIDSRLVTEIVLGNAVLVMLNLRFFDHVQMEPIHFLIILMQSVPILFFLYPKKRLAVFYVVSSIGLIFTGVAGIIYIRSWPFCAFMTELSSSLSNLFGTTGVGEVPAQTFLSWIIFFYLSFTLGVVVDMPIDAIRRKMEVLFIRNRLRDLKKMYDAAVVVMFVGCILFVLCLYPLLLEYYPTFAMKQQGELTHYDLFWVFLVLYSAVFAAKLIFSRYELYRPIALLETKRLSE